MTTKSVTLRLPTTLYEALLRQRSAAQVQIAAATARTARNRPLPMAEWVDTTGDGKLALSKAMGIAHANPTRIGSDQANAFLTDAYKAYRAAFPKRKPGRPKTIISLRETSTAIRDELAAVLIEYLTKATTTEINDVIDHASCRLTTSARAGGGKAAGVGLSAG